MALHQLELLYDAPRLVEVISAEGSDLVFVRLTGEQEWRGGGIGCVGWSGGVGCVDEGRELAVGDAERAVGRSGFAELTGGVEVEVSMLDGGGGDDELELAWGRRGDV